jgi:hypothetical protein
MLDSSAGSPVQLNHIWLIQRINHPPLAFANSRGLTFQERAFFVKRCNISGVAKAPSGRPGVVQRPVSILDLASQSDKRGHDIHAAN